MAVRGNRVGSISKGRRANPRGGGEVRSIARKNTQNRYRSCAEPSTLVVTDELKFANGPPKQCDDRIEIRRAPETNRVYAKNKTQKNDARAKMKTLKTRLSVYKRKVCFFESVFTRVKKKMFDLEIIGFT